MARKERIIETSERDTLTHAAKRSSKNVRWSWPTLSWTTTWHTWCRPGNCQRLPETGEMKSLYEDLWGRVGLPNPIFPGNRASEMLLHEFFPPITAENVSERLKKMRKTTAARPEGLQKEHLLMPGLPAIIAKLYNILCFSSYFPIGRIRGLRWYPKGRRA